jgi:hypothetical protein
MLHNPVGPGLTCPTAMAVMKSDSFAQPRVNKSLCRNGRFPRPPVDSREAFRKSQK